jgi:hypothetical protein
MFFYCVSQDMYLQAGGPALQMDVFPLHLFSNKDLKRHLYLAYCPSRKKYSLCFEMLATV